MMFLSINYCVGIRDFEIKLKDFDGVLFSNVEPTQDGINKVVIGLNKNGKEEPAIEQEVLLLYWLTTKELKH